MVEAFRHSEDMMAKPGAKPVSVPGHKRSKPEDGTPKTKEVPVKPHSRGKPKK